VSNPTVHVSSACTNCGDPQTAVYCARCGERQPGHHDLTVKHVLHEAVHELAHLDGKLFRTLRELILRPGQLTREYFAGQKQRSVPPLRLFLTLFALQFVAYTAYKPAAVYSVRTFRKFDTRGGLKTLLDRKAAKHHITAEAYAEELDHRWQKNLSMLQLANIIGIATVLKILYVRRKRVFVEHLVFAAHYLCFSYVLSLLIWPIYAVMGFTPGPLQKVLSATHILANVIYLFFSQRRYYGLGTGKTIFKTVLVWGGTFVVSVTIMAGALIVAVLQYG
jgi:hypothetical protein